jgi:hypothetical protein
LALAAASAAEPPAEDGGRPSDAGIPARAHDAGRPLAASTRDAGPSAAMPTSAEDLEVIENYELLEHLPESEVLDLLLPLGVESRTSFVDGGAR